MRYRYLDLRTERMQRNLQLRANAAIAVRTFLAAEGFWEIETPILFKPTPEGARDYLVPSRVNPGRFYALPQSPQILKQLLMVAGIDRYCQLARCFRDEDLRSDRQPEHTQIDLEMSFVDREDIFDVVERLFAHMFREVLGYELETPFPRMTHREARDRFGTDKPDLRFGLELHDLSDLAARTDFRVFRQALDLGGQVKGLCAPGCGAYSRSQMDDLTEFAKQHKAGGLAWLALGEDGAARGPIAKFLSEEQLAELLTRLDAGPGDLLLIVADRAPIVAESLDWLRREMAGRLDLIPDGVFKPLWVLDFPMFAWNEEEKRWEAEHHPFCMPHPDDVDKLDTDQAAVRALAYDAVLNGTEVASGSIRIHRRDIQEKIFDTLGITREDADLTSIAPSTGHASSQCAHERHRVRSRITPSSPIDRAVRGQASMHLSQPSGHSDASSCIPVEKCGMPPTSRIGMTSSSVPFQVLRATIVTARVGQNVAQSPQSEHVSRSTCGTVLSPCFSRPSDSFGQTCLHNSQPMHESISKMSSMESTHSVCVIFMNLSSTVFFLLCLTAYLLETAFSTFTAQTLNSGIFAIGSRAEIVSAFAALSRKLKGMNTVPLGTELVSLARIFTSPLLLETFIMSLSLMPRSSASVGLMSAAAPAISRLRVGLLRVMVPVW